MKVNISKYKDRLIYLASPFSHANIGVMNLRGALIDAIGAAIVQQGYHIFGPISESKCYSHNTSGLVGTSWEYWQEHDLLMISRCDEMWVIKMKGWEKSKGVTAEIEHAQLLDKPIRFFDVEEWFPDIHELV